MVPTSKLHQNLSFASVPGPKLWLSRWMLGVLIYEFMTGSAPFEAPYPMQIYAKVLTLGFFLSFCPTLVRTNDINIINWYILHISGGVFRDLAEKTCSLLVFFQKLFMAAEEGNQCCEVSSTAFSTVRWHHQGGSGWESSGTSFQKRAQTFVSDESKWIEMCFCMFLWCFDVTLIVITAALPTCFSQAICQKEPADRLPMLTGGSKNIKTHVPWGCRCH